MLLKGSTKVVDCGCDRHIQGTERNPVGCMDVWFSIVVHTWSVLSGVGAACTWRTPSGWTGQRYHLGINKGVFDVEVYAIYRALRILDQK